MDAFVMQDIGAWERVDGAGEVDFPGDDTQRLRFDIMASGKIRAFMSDDATDEPVLVAYGAGLLRVRCTVYGAAVLQVIGDDECAEVFIRRRRSAQVIAESDVPSFTTIEPRASGPSAEFRRMVHIVQMNAQRREAALRQEMARMRGTLDGLAAARPAPAGPPEPAAEPAVEPA